MSEQLNSIDRDVLGAVGRVHVVIADLLHDEAGVSHQPEELLLDLQRSSLVGDDDLSLSTLAVVCARVEAVARVALISHEAGEGVYQRLEQVVEPNHVRRYDEVKRPISYHLAKIIAPPQLGHLTVSSARAVTARV